MICDECFCVLSVREESANPRRYRKVTAKGTQEYLRRLCDLCDNGEMDKLKVKNGRGEPRRAGE